ncbi:hypothetical protein U9869_29095, partial [Escherichia coli]
CFFFVHGLRKQSVQMRRDFCDIRVNILFEQGTLHPGQRFAFFVNATMFDRYLPFSCPLNTFVTDAVRFSPFHHH